MKKVQVAILLLKLKNSGSERDYRIFFHFFYDRFFRIACYYLKNEENAQEVILDVFYTLWEKRKELADMKHFDNYCFTLLKNAALNLLDKTKRRMTTSLDNPDLAAATDTPENSIVNEEIMLEYVKALDRLPARCREVFILAREEGLSYKEVALRMNISEKTVDAQLQKALSRLKISLKKFFL